MGCEFFLPVLNMLCFLEEFQENSKYAETQLILRFINTKAQYCLYSKTVDPMDYFVQP